MVTTLLLNIFNLMVVWFLSMRPSWQPTIPPAVAQTLSFYRAYDTLIPVGETLTALGLTCAGVLVFVVLKWTVKLVDWVADIIP